MANFKVWGCRQGYGMDADKFYNAVEEIQAENMEQAKSQAVQLGLFVEGAEEVPERIYTEVNGKLILGIGREYSPEEKKEILGFAKQNGYKVPKSCHAGIYLKGGAK